jgi:hypothetical protein
MANIARTLMTPHDRDLAEKAYMAFNEDVIPDAPPFVVLKSRQTRVDFQFPPKVLSDSRKGSWEEIEAWGVAPIAIYKASQPRVISLQATYILDGDWTADIIKSNVQLIRGYFQRVKDRAGARNAEAEKDNRNLAIELKLWAIGGEKPMTFRIGQCDVKYSETLIGSGNKAWPLKTEINLDLATWTQEGNQALTILAPYLTTDWY